MQFDSVQIGVTDLDQATRNYTLLLGIAPSVVSDRCRFQLGRGAVELVPGEDRLESLRFVPQATDPDAIEPLPAMAFHGLRVQVTSVSPVLRPESAASPGHVDAIDHIVIHSSDLDRAVALWRDRLGVRLALDREFPTRGLRLLFFRSGGVTLEFAGTLEPPADRGPDRLYGIAYRIRDLDACCARLRRSGIDISAIRPGHKAGTRVATVRTHTAEVPTLLIGDATPADA